MSNPHFLTLSANTHPELEEKLTQIMEHLTTTRSGDCVDLPLTVRSDHNQNPIRLAVFGNSREEILKKLKSSDYQVTPGTLRSQKPKLCFQYTGQGAQFHGMGEGLYNSFPVYREQFEKCSLFFKQKYGLDLSRVPPEVENKSTFLQKAYGLLPTLTLQFSLFKLWESWGIKPDTILTHSLGEYAAAVQCGYISFEVAATILTEECRCFELLLRDGRMLVIKRSKQEATNLIQQLPKSSKVEVALDNSPSQVVVSGKSQNIEEFQEICDKEGIQSRMIPVTLAYHSSMMRPVYQHCLRRTSSLHFSATPKTFPYISGMTGRKLRDGEMTASFWCDHFTSPVNFQAASTAAINEGCEFFLEIGPRPVLSPFLHEIFSDMKQGKESAPTHTEIYCLPSIKSNSDECSTILNSLAQLYVNGWNVIYP